ncbi:putative oxidoreductase EphD [Grifola frondosa]|uniref:Putative oxidoreductase EphD n=1 Tax=Grifola frondosa TaxID=5627 RepID=A0A1C7LXK6_GRIFR|nr:putative oxidoreductase EphD [Grifola frondosa]
MSPTPSVKIVKSSDGTPIYAEAIGNPANPSVVLVHGMTLSAATFDLLFNDQRLVDQLYLVRYDLRGHGRSGKPTNIENYASALFADDFAAVAREFNLTKPVQVGWSYGATIATDICANIDPIPISGVVYLGALPYISNPMPNVGTPLISSFLPGLCSTDNVALSLRTKIDFVDSLFVDPESVPLTFKSAWIGQSVFQPPEITMLVLSRPQDPTKFLEAGKKGLPMLVLNGTDDKQVVGELVAKEMKPHFPDMEVKFVKGGSHALFYDFPDEFAEALLAFVHRVVKNADMVRRRNVFGNSRISTWLQSVYKCGSRKST